MLHQIQNHLFQYKTVVIPEVGTFQTEQVPATLDIANQLMMPPALSVKCGGGAVVSPQQLQAFAADYDYDTEAAAQVLASFGAAFRERLRQQSVHWSGIGVLQLSEAQEVQLTADTAGGLLMPVHAQKVLRENVQHNVLVGDQEMLYGSDGAEAGLPEKSSRAWLILTGWVLALLAIAFIIYHLYTHNWAPGASGLRRQPVIENSPVQHR